jgi:hypothetical protein
MAEGLFVIPTAVEGPAVSLILYDLNGSTTLPFVIPIEAYPDFLPRSTGQGRA